MGSTRDGRPRPLSLAARLLPAVQRLRHANQHYLSAENLHRHLQQLAVHPRSVRPPRRLSRGVSVAQREQRGWQIYTISPKSTRGRGTVVYLHGGGWIHQAGNTHWRWVQRLAKDASTTVVLPVYPLAQEGGTAETVVPFVADLCERSTAPIVLMGDSAGGTIAISVTLLLKQRQAAERPALTVLISPALDISLSNPEINIVQRRDPWLAKPGSQDDHHCGAGCRRRDSWPAVAPATGARRCGTAC